MLLFAFNIYFNTVVRMAWDFVVVMPGFWIMVQLFGEDWWVTLREFSTVNSKYQLENWKMDVARSKRIGTLRRQAHGDTRVEITANSRHSEARENRQRVINIPRHQYAATAMV